MAEGLCPAAYIAEGRSRSNWGGMLGMLHDLLLLDVLLEGRLFASSMSHEQVVVHEAFSGLLRPLFIGEISATGVLRLIPSVPSFSGWKLRE